MNSSCKKVPSKFVLINDISLHILILFTILSSLFVFYISKKETEAINGEIIEYIDKFDLDKYPQYKTFITDYINDYVPKLAPNAIDLVNNTYIPNTLEPVVKNFITNIGTSCSPTDTFPCTPCDTSKDILNLCNNNICTKDNKPCTKDPLNIFARGYLSSENGKKLLNSEIDSNVPYLKDYVTKEINNNIPNVQKYISEQNIEKNILKPEYFDFLIKELSNSPNRLTEEINLKVKEELCICIGFLITIALIINIVPIKLFKYCNNTITSIIGELIIVFILIGIIEVWFFKNIATKFVATKPSLIVQTFKDKLLSIING